MSSPFQHTTVITQFNLNAKLSIRSIKNMNKYDSVLLDHYKFTLLKRMKNDTKRPKQYWISNMQKGKNHLKLKLFFLSGSGITLNSFQYIFYLF